MSIASNIIPVHVSLCFKKLWNIVCQEQVLKEDASYREYKKRPLELV